MEQDFLKDVHASTIPDLLRKMAGKEVTLMLTTGDRISGVLSDADVNYTSHHTKLVRLTKLTGQEYYDAVVALGSVYGIVLLNPKHSD
jgi:hypothetical protein